MTDYSPAPAPWELTGRAYLSLLRLPDELLDAHSFVPDTLRGRRRTGLSMLMFVDYATSPVGPYRELLFIPGQFEFEDGRNRFSISRIFVSSQDSVENGRRNWGIPKELAEFTVVDRPDGHTTVSVSQNDQQFAELAFRHYGPALPIPRGILPRAWRTLAQHHQEQIFVYTPNAGGSAQLARLEDWRFDSSLFPDLSQGKTLMSFYLRRFRMSFPVARLRPRHPQ